MKTKIQIKTVFGKLIFEYEKENNTIKDTLIEAMQNMIIDFRDADFRDADFRDADLRGVDLSGAYLRGADLRGADLRGTDLRDADLRGTYLSDADFRGTYLRGADLRGADLRDAKENKINIKKIAVFIGLYQYSVYAIIDSRNSKWIKMGCYLRRLKEWEKDFWNNTSEFPNDNSEKSQLRLFAFETAKQWFKIINTK